MGFAKTKAELDYYYGLGVRKFFGARMLTCLFQTKPEIVERLLPAPLQPLDVPNALIFIADYPETNLGPGYREAALFLMCQYNGEIGNYCLSMPIDSSAARMHNGRDIFGLPKKMANIHFEQNGDEVTGWVEREGVRFVEIKTTLVGSLPEFMQPGPNFLFKAMPRIDLKPGFDGPVLLCRQQTDIKMTSLQYGTPELTLTHSDVDPWAELEVEQVLMSTLLVSDNTMQPGSVLGEVDADAFLPHYFKMTDLVVS